MARTITYNRQAHRRGLALVETALVLVILMLLAMGVLQYGWAFMCLQRATNAARQGARMEAVADAPVGEAKLAMENLIPAAEFAGRTCAVTTASSYVRANVFIPAASVQLIDWNLLPVPDLDVTVTMRKEEP